MLQPAHVTGYLECAGCCLLPTRLIQRNRGCPDHAETQHKQPWEHSPAAVAVPDRPAGHRKARGQKAARHGSLSTFSRYLKMSQELYLQAAYLEDAIGLRMLEDPAVAGHCPPGPAAMVDL